MSKPALFSVATETPVAGNRSICEYPKWKEKEPQNGPCKPFVQFNYPLKRRKEQYFLLVIHISNTTTALTSPDPDAVTSMVSLTTSGRTEMTRTSKGKLFLFDKKENVPVECRHISNITTALTSPDPETVTSLVTLTNSDRTEMTKTRKGTLCFFRFIRWFGLTTVLTVCGSLKASVWYSVIVIA